MAAVRPTPADLVGRFIRLTPMRHDDIPALFEAIAHPEVFAGGYGGGPAGLPPDLERFTSFAESSYAWDVSNVYAVRVEGGVDAGRLIGTTTLGDFDEKNGSAHIGWTAYDPRVWSSPVNPEAKLLLLTLAFESGFERIKIQADSVNARSRGAILKLGATFEGIHRHDRVRADGSWRDTAVYSILAGEWPPIRERLMERLEAFDGAVELAPVTAPIAQ